MDGGGEREGGIVGLRTGLETLWLAPKDGAGAYCRNIPVGDTLK